MAGEPQTEDISSYHDNKIYYTLCTSGGYILELERRIINPVRTGLFWPKKTSFSNKKNKGTFTLTTFKVVRVKVVLFFYFPFFSTL